MIETIKTAAAEAGIEVAEIVEIAAGFAVETAYGDHLLVTATDVAGAAAEMAEQVADRWAVENRSLGDDEE